MGCTGGNNEPAALLEDADVHLRVRRQAPWYAGLPEPAWSVGSHHLSDVAYFFELSIFDQPTPAQAALSNELIARCSAFARTGNPNTLGTAAWPQAKPFDRQVQSLTPAGTTRTDLLTDHRIAFWR
jgi:para-nitrobenzyl esterase